MGSRTWLKVVLSINVAVFTVAAAYVALRLLLGDLFFCEFADSTWGEQRWTGIIPEPSCVYTGTSQGVRGVEFVVPARFAPVHLLVVTGVTIAIAAIGLSRTRRESQAEESSSVSTTVD